MRQAELDLLRYWQSSFVHHELNRDDFYCFYNLYNLDALITKKQASSGSLRHYQEYTKIILAEDSYG